MGRAYTSDPGYTGWKSRNLLQALGQGAIIVTTDSRWEGREVEYKPRELREQYPWQVKGEDYHSARVRSIFCQPVDKEGEPWSAGEAIRSRLK